MEPSKEERSRNLSVLQSGRTGLLGVLMAILYTRLLGVAESAVQMSSYKYIGAVSKFCPVSTVNVGAISGLNFESGFVYVAVSEKQSGIIYVSKYVWDSQNLANCPSETLNTVTWHNAGFGTPQFMGVNAILYERTTPSQYLYFIATSNTDGINSSIRKCDITTGGASTNVQMAQVTVANRDLAHLVKITDNMFVVGGLLLYIDPTTIGMLTEFSSFGDLQLYQSNDFKYLTCSSATCFAWMTQTSGSSKLVSVDITVFTSLSMTEILLDMQGLAEDILALRYLPQSSCLAACTPRRCAVIPVSNPSASKWSQLLSQGLVGNVILDSKLFGPPGPEYLLVAGSSLSTLNLQVFTLADSNSRLEFYSGGLVQVQDNIGHTGSTPVDLRAARLGVNASSVVMVFDTPDLYFYESQTCHSNCQTCNGPNESNCITCLSGNIMKSGSCWACHPSCRECSQSNSQECTSCPDNLFLVQNPVTSKNLCENLGNDLRYKKTWPNAVRCSNPDCLDCHLDSTSCLQCQSQLFLDQTAAPICKNIFTSGTFADLTSKTVKYCSGNCSECFGSNATCTNCITGYGIDNNTRSCLETSNSTVVPTGLKYLYACDPNCQSCTGTPVNCSACPANNFIYSDLNNTCLSENRTEYYFLTPTGYSPCQGNCFKCLNATFCTGCYPGGILNPATGICKEPPYTMPGYYLVTAAATKTFLPCPANCSECTQTQCLKCTSGFGLNPLTLACQTCLSDQYLDFSGFCSPCSPDCLTCQKKADICTSCSPPKLLVGDKCLSIPGCPIGTYLSSGSCLSCHESCNTCSQSATNCTSCYTHRDVKGFLLNTTGTLTCTVYQNAGYQDPTNNSVLLACDSTCATCVATATGSACSSCPPTMGIDPVNKTCKPCLLGSGQYLSRTNTCLNCDPLCLSCFVRPDWCFSCVASAFLEPISWKCYASCPSGFYSVTTPANSCLPCEPTCAECIGPGPANCTSCKPGFSLDAATPGPCIFCPITNRYISLPNLICSTGPIGCKFADSTGCQQCTGSPNQYMTTAGCSTCSAGFFARTDGICSPLPPSCTEMSITSPQICQSCSSGYFLSAANGTCTTCTGAFVPSSLANNCLDCSHACAECASVPQSCTTCSVPSLLFVDVASKQCTPCSKGKLMSAGGCQPCHVSCLECSNTPNSCSKCPPNLFISSVNGTCSQCGNGFFTETIDTVSYCKPCSSNCQTCQNSSTICTSCQIGLYIMPDGSCSNCPAGYFIQDSSCIQCAFPCNACSTSSTNCLGCMNGYELSGSSCISNCPPDQYWDSNSVSCKKCSLSCSTCYGSAERCTSCVSVPTGKKIHSSSKFCRACQPGQTTDLSATVCLDCNPSCLTCQLGNPSKCTSCEVGKYLSSAYDGCAPCSDGWYLTGNQYCEKCSPTCTKCAAQPENCSQCKPGYHLKSSLPNSNCEPCGPGYFLNLAGLCSACDSSCALCEGTATNCTACPASSYLSVANQTCGACDSGYFLDFENKCRKCDPNCLECSGISSRCTACTIGQFVSTLTDRCGPCGAGMFLTGNPQVCSPCNANCLECSTLSTNCTVCHPNKALFKSLAGNNFCATYETLTVKASFYDPTGFFGECDPQCSACSFNSSFCLSCVQPNLYPAVGTGTCVPCANGGGVNSVGQCHNCIDSSCLNCPILPENCIQCSTGLYPSATNKACSNCGDGYFVDLAGICQPCDSSCLKCSIRPNNCTQCKFPEHYLNLATGLCSNCSGTRTIRSGFCVDCNQSCGLCFTEPTNCTTCKTTLVSVSATNWFQNNNSFGLVDSTPGSQTCAVCPANISYNIRGKCTNCKMGCSNCTYQGARCVLCSSSAEYASYETGECGTCPSIGFGITPTNMCVRCAPNCQTCSNSTGCLTCRTGLYIRQDLGYNCDVCPQGYYINTTTSQCLACNSSCATCNGPLISDCLTCNTAVGMYNFSGQCTNCTDPVLYIRGDSCIPCDSTCKNCSGFATQCTACQSGKYLLDQTVGKCVDNCPTGDRWIITSDNLACRKCSPGCKSCSGLETECTVCYPGFMLVNVLPQATTCKPIGNGGYYNISATQALPLQTGCKFSFSTPLDCDICSADGQFPNTTGVCQAKQTQTYLDRRNHQQPCNSNCKTCTKSDTMCFRCPTNFSLVLPNRTCVECNTTVRYAKEFNATHGWTCEQCPADCLSCNSVGKCLSCFPGYVLQTPSNRCISSNGPNQYLDDATPPVVQTCDPNCRSCAGFANRCVTCYAGYLLEGLGLTCIPASTPGYFLFTDNYLYPCDPSCKTCQNHSRNCLSCPVSQYLDPQLNLCVTCSQQMEYLNQYNECVSCQPLCLVCQNQTGTCQQCFPGHAFDESGACVNLGTPGLYFDTNLNMVKPCNSQCLTCGDSPDYCLSCNNSIGLFLDVEFNKCRYLNLGYSGARGVYQQCDSNCLTCEQDRAFSCVSCNPGFVLSTSNPGNLKRCILASECGRGKFVDQANICRPCRAGCAECAPITGSCNLCLPSYLKLAGSDVCVQCGNGTFVDTNNCCQPCHSNCATCAESATMCTSCLAPAALFRENSTCGLCVNMPGRYINEQGECAYCSSNCANCSQFGFLCTSCNPGQILSRTNSTCINSCNTPGFYLDSQNKCSECAVECLNCVAPDGKCTQCASGMIPNAQGVCMDCTLPGRFINSDNFCQLCAPGCDVCQGSPNNCLLCNSRAGLYRAPDLSCNTCDKGWYVNGADCLQCDPQCLTCSKTPTSCTSCQPTAFLMRSSFSCLPTCPEAYFDWKGECLRCPANCKICSSQTGFCTECYQPYGLLKSGTPSCVICPKGYFKNNNQACTPCDTNCAECSKSATNCTSCAGGFGLVTAADGLTKICSNCGPGSLLDSQSLLCLPCNSECSSCQNSITKCNQCQRPRFLHQGKITCVNLSGSRFFTTSSVDYNSCDLNCKECSVQGMYCTACAQGSILSATNLTCGGCGDGYYVSSTDQRCYPCSSSCRTCSQSSTICTSCPTGLYLDVTGTQCSICGSGFTVSLDTGSCIACNSNCLECDGYSQRCRTCQTSGQFVSEANRTCGACGDGYFVDIRNFCVKCSSNCTTCNKGPELCTTCQAGKYVSTTNYTCDFCGDGYFIQGANCVPCSSNCKTCTGSQNACTSCASPLYLTMTAPANSCTDCSASGFTLVSGICQPCIAPCLNCNMKTTNCTSCMALSDKLLMPKSLTQDTTCNSCLATGLFVNNADSKCYYCDLNCASCSGTSTNCTSCLPNQYVRRDSGNICSPSCPAGLFTETLSGVNYCGCNSPCATCKNKGTQCNSCVSGYYIQGNSCNPCNDPNCDICSPHTGICTVCQPNYEINTANSSCRLSCLAGTYWTGTVCSLCDTKCQECAGSATACTKCPSGGYLYPNSTCGSCGEQGWFVNGNLCTACHKTCLQCNSTTSASCTSCPITAKLVNGTCEPIPGDPIILNCSQSTEPISGTDLVLLLKPNSGWLKLGEEQDSAFWQNLSTSLIFKLTINSTSPNSGKILPTMVTKSLEQAAWMSLRVKFRESPTETLYNVDCESESSSAFVFKNNLYRVVRNSSRSNWTNAIATSELASAQGQGQVAGALMGGFGGHGTGSTIVGTLLVIAAGDPSGTLAKFSQLMKLNSKLLYLSVEYGPLQRTFLETADDASGTFKESSINAVVSNSRGYRGKLTFYKVLVNAESEMFWKMAVYVACWILKGISMYVMEQNRSLSRGTLIALFYQPKLHLLVFNVVMVDFMFYLPRTMLHSNNLWSISFSYVTLWLICIDLCLIFRDTVSEENWRYCYQKELILKQEDDFFEEIMKQMEKKPQDYSRQLSGSEKELGSASVEYGESLHNLNKTVELPKDPLVRLERYKKENLDSLKQYKNPDLLIDYSLTIRNIRNDIHLLSLMADALKVEPQVYQSVLCRFGFLIHCFRLSIYQVIVIVGQYMTTTSIVCLVCLEGSKLILTSILYVKKKHYKQVLLFLLDVMQSVFMLAFLLFTTGYIHRDMLWNPIPKDEQQASVYLIMGASVIEYLLLFSYGISCAVQYIRRFFRYRKLSKYRKRFSVWDFLVLAKPAVLNAEAAGGDSYHRTNSQEMSSVKSIPLANAFLSSAAIPVHLRQRFAKPVAKPRLEAAAIRLLRGNLDKAKKGPAQIQIPEASRVPAEEIIAPEEIGQPITRAASPRHAARPSSRRQAPSRVLPIPNEMRSSITGASSILSSPNTKETGASSENVSPISKTRVVDKTSAQLKSELQQLQDEEFGGGVWEKPNGPSTRRVPPANGKVGAIQPQEILSAQKFEGPVAALRKENLIFSETKDVAQDALQEVMQQMEEPKHRFDSTDQASVDEAMQIKVPQVNEKHSVQPSKITNWIMSRMGG